jgi:DNA-binding transcriptional MerR regulator
VITLHTPALRTVDVARLTGYSVQQIRKLEREGVIPPAHRSATGYRQYQALHVQTIQAYRPLAVALGPVRAKQFLRDLQQHDEKATLAALDEAHKNLSLEREALAWAQEAALHIADEPMGDSSDADTFTIGELATALGIRASTLRFWDSQGLAQPDRGAGRSRRYSPAQVRETRIIQQLRTAGQPIPSIRQLLPALRAGHDTEQLTAALAARRENITHRSRHLLIASPPLLALLASSDHTPHGRDHDTPPAEPACDS